MWLSDADYDFIYSRVPRICIDLVIKTPHGILLTKRGIQPYKGTWHIPGGRIQFRENLQNAASRIAKKELGVSVKLGQLLGCLEFLRETQDKSPRHSVSLVFLATPSSKGVKNVNWQVQSVFFKKLPINPHPVHAKFLLKHKLLP